MANGDMERTRLANERPYLAWWRIGLLHSSTASFGTGRSTRRCARAASLGRDGALLLLAAIGVAAGVASIVLVLFAP